MKTWIYIKPRRIQHAIRLIANVNFLNHRSNLKDATTQQSMVFRNWFVTYEAPLKLSECKIRKYLKVAPKGLKTKQMKSNENKLHFAKGKQTLKSIFFTWAIYTPPR